MRKGHYIALGLVAVLLLAVSLGLWQFQQRTDPGAEEPPGGEIALPSTQGEFVLSALDEDQLAVLYFGYTYCPDICPLSLSVMRQAMSRLGPERAERIVPVLISVDPARDSLARLEQYVGFFGDDFLGVRGSEEQLNDVAKRYGVVWRKVSSGPADDDYTVDHTSSLFVVDREGEIRQRVLYSPTPQALTAALEMELAEQEGAGNDG
ncbi:SCO family protein [Pistricoccus aurantiacus]|uniref:SCO family protein n=1 Tax=Pistricoccus aurantiacus TaxID=1883414 RepID=A0A5B8SP39_9GAMM|nr:SCO family protein [Pistricoccus aurantiacus]QEA38486.1 SCO family protein [Pistricoccus aurantiacus]